VKKNSMFDQVPEPEEITGLSIELDKKAVLLL